MTDQWPKIKGRRTTKLSPWADIIEREIEFTPGGKPEIYHAVGQPDYIAMLAMTPDGRIPIVRQYRPALEAFTWELPAGTVDDGESASARRKPRIDGRDRLSLAQGASARRPSRPAPGGSPTRCIRSSSRPAKRSPATQAGAGHRGSARHAGRACRHHQGRAVRFPAASRHAPAGAAAWRPRFADCIKIADNRASVRGPRTSPGYGVQCD